MTDHSGQRSVGRGQKTDVYEVGSWNAEVGNESAKDRNPQL